MRECNAVDFDDLLFFPALGLKNDADLREELDARFRFVLIDEYQDTNHAQYVIARQLSVNYPNLCVVGDPDQSIYKFRGSDIRNILDFERDFPQTRVLTLNLNYRSTKSILQAASHLIAHNRQRKPKDLETENPQGQPVTVLTYETGKDEADGIAQRIQAAVADGQALLSRFRRLSADQCSEPGGRAGLCQQTYSLPDRQRPGLLRPQGESRRVGLSATAGQSARQSLVSCAVSTSRPGASARPPWNIYASTPSRAS